MVLVVLAGRFVLRGGRWVVGFGNEWVVEARVAMAMKMWKVRIAGGGECGGEADMVS